MKNTSYLVVNQDQKEKLAGFGVVSPLILHSLWYYGLNWNHSSHGLPVY